VLAARADGRMLRDSAGVGRRDAVDVAMRIAVPVPAHAHDIGCPWTQDFRSVAQTVIALHTSELKDSGFSDASDNGTEGDDGATAG
jgi:hypothetical protein